MKEKKFKDMNLMYDCECGKRFSVDGKRHFYICPECSAKNWVVYINPVAVDENTIVYGCLNFPALIEDVKNDMAKAGHSV